MLSERRFIAELSVSRHVVTIDNRRKITEIRFAF